MKQFWAKAWAKLKAIFGVVKWRDVAIRAGKTIVQAFVASVGVSLASGRSLDTVLTSALAGVASALWNGVLAPVWAAIGKKADEELNVKEPGDDGNG